MSNTWRLFIAVALPGPAISALKESQEALQAAGAPRLVTWVAPANIHLTLKFLGETPLTQCAVIAEALSDVAGLHSQFTLYTTGLGCFPNPRKPRVIWAGLGGDIDALLRLHQSVERALAQLGHPPEQRSFSPHLTLGRVRRDASRAELERLGIVIGNSAPPAPVRWAVTELSLYRSELKPGGPIYTSLHSASLRQDS
jgi:2'-5' RNA ligase